MIPSGLLRAWSIKTRSGRARKYPSELGANQSRSQAAAAARPSQSGEGPWFFLRRSNAPRTHTLHYLPHVESVTRHVSDHNPARPARMEQSKNSSSSRSAAVPVEEPEYLARYLVIKHSWRGRYKRILCLSNASIITLDPATLAVTNSYDVATDFDTAAPIIGRDENSNEFNLSVRTDGRGKFKSVKFSSRYRASILTELHRLRGNRLGAVAEFPVLHLRRRNAEWVPFVSWLLLQVLFVQCVFTLLIAEDLIGNC